MRSVEAESEQATKVYSRYAWRIGFVNIGYYISLLFKSISGFRWLRKKNRSNYVPYYIWGLTYALYTILIVFEYLSMSLSSYDDYRGRGVIYGFIFCLSWGSIEIILLEVHMRYLDSVHIARNDLKRDRAILENFKKLQLSEFEQRSNSLFAAR